MDGLNETAVLSNLRTLWLGQACHYWPEVASTNESLKQAVAAGTTVSPAHGTLHLTDFQTQGRGRLRRIWQAPAGTSLLFSLLFRPDWPGEQANWLTMLTTLAAADAIEAATELKVGIKWPNDLMVCHESVWHKVGGILLEGNLDERGVLRSAIVGVGLNVNIPFGQLPVTETPVASLLVLTGRPVDRVSLLTDLLWRLEAGYGTAVAGQSPHSAWNERLVTRGKSVTVTSVVDATRTVIYGTAEGTDRYGSLLLRDESGHWHTISAGDVTLRT